MRVTIVCPSYERGLSYQENVWAEQLTRKGHDVTLIAAGRPGQRSSELIAVGDSQYALHFARTRRLPHGIYIARGVGDLIAQARPDLILMMGDKAFGRDVWRRREFAAVPVISFFSENLGHHEYDWRKPGISLKQRGMALAYQLLRGRSMRACCRRSALLVGNTTQAADVLLPLFRDEGERNNVAGKLIQKPLGFSPEHFCFAPEIRKAQREKLGIGPDEIVICAASRMQPDKLPILLPIVAALHKLMPMPLGASIRPLIIGLDQSAVAAQLEQAIAQGPHADRFVRHPFAARQALNALFNAADVAIFGRASIACQEALATGVQTCFDNAGALDHLVTRSDQAMFFERNDSAELAAKLQILANELRSLSSQGRELRRRERAQAALWLSYGQIVDDVLAELMRLTNKRQ